MKLRRPPRATAWWIGAAVAIAGLAVIALTVDTSALARAGRAAVRSPETVLVLLLCYGTAFFIRAWAWRRTLPGLGLGHSLAAVHVALAGNHLLPFRLGEVLRVTSVVRRAQVGMRQAAATTVTLRAADVAVVLGLALLTGPAVVDGLVGGSGPLLAAGAVLGAVTGGWWIRRLAVSRAGTVRLPGPLVLAATLLAWLLEAAVVWQAAAWVGVTLSPSGAVLVTAVTIAAQVVAIAPGGLGTYEAAATASLVALGAEPATALAVALVAHAFKTGYALLAGTIGFFVPSPGMLGRLRLPASVPDRGVPGPPHLEGHVALFLPAYNEAALIGGVIRRVPAEVHGRPVRFYVVDDGSTDATAAIATRSGAEVLPLGGNQGLGAAVRAGLAEGVRGGAAAIAFCDADGEYAPEELSRLVAPILDGSAEYVIGSRFGGRIDRMLPHRRLGNRVLTSLLRVVARTDITDGQSGYRALSRDAAAAAEVIHDFNYAQVLTLDLLAKGFRYAEVPISYRFREAGRSFVKLVPYLRAVVPAVWRELNAEPAAS